MRLNLRKTGGALALVGALVLALAMVAFSQGPRHGGPHGGPGGPGGHGGPGGDMRGHLEMMARELGLTDDQQAQIKKIHESFQESTKALHEQLRAQHESQPDPLASGGAFDEAAVRAAAEARARIHVELEVAHARMMSQFINVLTAEQKAKLAAKHKEMEQRRAERRPPAPPTEEQ